MKILFVIKNQFLVILTILIFTNSEAQFFKTTLKASLLSPPTKDIGNVNRIAILDFENVSSQEYKSAGADIGSKLTDYLSTALLKEYRGKSEDCYLIGGRTDIYTMLKEKNWKKFSMN
jgi:hypothetical protein